MTSEKFDPDDPEISKIQHQQVEQFEALLDALFEAFEVQTGNISVKYVESGHERQWLKVHGVLCVLCAL